MTMIKSLVLAVFSLLFCAANVAAQGIIPPTNKIALAVGNAISDGTATGSLIGTAAAAKLGNKFYFSNYSGGFTKVDPVFSQLDSFQLGKQGPWDICPSQVMGVAVPGFNFVQPGGYTGGSSDPIFTYFVDPDTLKYSSAPQWPKHATPRNCSAMADGSVAVLGIQSGSTWELDVFGGDKNSPAFKNAYFFTQELRYPYADGVVACAHTAPWCLIALVGRTFTNGQMTYDNPLLLKFQDGQVVETISLPAKATQIVISPDDTMMYLIDPAVSIMPYKTDKLELITNDPFVTKGYKPQSLFYSENGSVVYASFANTLWQIDAHNGNTLMYMGEPGQYYNFRFGLAISMTGYDLVCGASADQLTCFQATLPPAITSVVDSAGYQADGFAPGSFVTAFGQGFTPTEASTGLFVAYSLADVSDSVDGQPARMYYGGPKQTNLALPQAIKVGTHTLTITTSSGAALTQAIKVVPQAIRLFQFWPDPNNHVLSVIVTTVDGHLVGNPKLPYNYAQLKSGDYAVLYGNGCGVTIPPIDDNEVSPGGLHRCTPPTIKVCGLPALVDYAGRAPGTASEDQFNFVIPACPSGPNDLEVNGIPYQKAVWIK